MDEEKYNECKLKIKIWEAQFKKKRGRIPSKVRRPLIFYCRY